MKICTHSDGQKYAVPVHLGSRHIDFHSQKMTFVARVRAERKTTGHLS